MVNQRAPTAFLFALLLLCGLFIAPAPPVSAQAPQTPLTQASAAGTLRIATATIEPFVFQQGEALRGYDVEIWEQIAKRLEWTYEWAFYPNIQEVLQAVQEKRADVAITAISMTAERDATLDFSYPYFDSGLQIMVRQRPSLDFFESLQLVVTPFLLEVVLTGLLAGLLMGHLIWLVERRSNPRFSRGYIAGVWEGLWWLLQIIASGSYHNTEETSTIKRLMTLVFWLTGVVILAEFTATLTSALTVHQLTPPIASASDLPGYRIATVQHTTAADFLDAHALDYTAVGQIEDAYSLLLDEKVDVIVFDAPVLLYYAAHEGAQKVAVPGRMFHLEKYGLALPIDSPLREPINNAILEMYQDGTIETLNQKWFGKP